MPSIDIVAVDHSGSYCIRRLKTTASGTVVQVLNPALNAGDHRTWHATGYVHDRATKPPSTTSTGWIAPPAQVVSECWAREDLTAGDLSRFKKQEGSVDPFLIDLRVSTGRRRFEAWYIAPDGVAALLDSLRGQAVPATLQIRQDADLGRVRVLAAFEPRQVAA